MRSLLLVVVVLLALGPEVCEAKRRSKAAATAAATTGDVVWDAFLASFHGADQIAGTADDPLAVDWLSYLGGYIYDVTAQPASGGGWIMLMSAPGGDVRYSLDPVDFPPGWWIYHGGHVDTGYDGDFINAIGLGLQTALLEPSLDAATFAVVLDGYNVWVAQHGVPVPR